MRFSYVNPNGQNIVNGTVESELVNPPSTSSIIYNMSWTFVNNDSVTPVPGDIARSSGQNFGAVLAQADSAAHSTGVLGVWLDSPAPGRSGSIKKDETVEVNCTESVTPGETLYLSAATAGKATKTAPDIQIVVGSVISTRTIDGVTKATVFWEGVASEATGGQYSTLAELDSQYNDGDTQLVSPAEKAAAGALAALAKGELLSKAVVTQGTNGDLLMWDSTQASGFRQITLSEVFRLKHAWYTMTALALDFANGFCQRLQLVNGANAITGMINAVPGINYKIKLIQPASGAAGTITLTPTSPNVVKVMGSLNLSPTNSKTNYLLITYDNTGDGEFSAAISQEF